MNKDSVIYEVVMMVKDFSIDQCYKWREMAIDRNCNEGVIGFIDRVIEVKKELECEKSI